MCIYACEYIAVYICVCVFCVEIMRDNVQACESN